MAGRLSFLADLNLSPLSLARLREAGWDVIRSSELLPAKATDAEILELAGRLERVVLTQDLDFSALLAVRGLASPSLVTLRLANPDPERVTQRLLAVSNLLEQVLRRPCAVTIDDNAVRVRNLPIE